MIKVIFAVLVLFAISGCSGFDDFDTDYDTGYTSDYKPGSVSGSVSTCYDSKYKPWNDVQVDSQCQAACAYKIGGNSQGVSTTCNILTKYGLDKYDCPACR